MQNPYNFHFTACSVQGKDVQLVGKIAEDCDNIFYQVAKVNIVNSRFEIRFLKAVKRLEGNDSVWIQRALSKVIHSQA